MGIQKKKAMATLLLTFGVSFSVLGLSMVILFSYYMFDRIDTINYLNEHKIGARGTVEEAYAEHMPVIVTWGAILVGATIITIIGAKKFKEVKKVEMEENAIKSAEYRNATQSHTTELKLWTDNVFTPMLKKHGISPVSRRVSVKKSTITLAGEEVYYTEVENYIFISDNALCLLPTYNAYKPWEHVGYYGSNLENELKTFFKLIQIPIEKIEHFSIGGEFYRENKISGGGGGGSSIGGAIVGGMIAGDVGAIIGSRQKNEAIKSELVTHDTRQVIVTYIENGKRMTLVFNHDDYKAFEDLIPEKNYNIVSEVRKQGLLQHSVKVDETKAITEQIKELAKLRDEGILTEEEFADKKKELLAKM